MYFYQLWVLAKRMGMLLLAYTFCRLLFYLFNYQTFEEASFGNVLLAFVLGIRFDTSVILLLNSLYLLLSILPITIVFKPWYQQMLRVIFFVINIPFLLINLADAPYFGFKGKRTTIDILGILDDVLDQSFQLMLHYWYVSVLLMVIVWLLWKYYPVLVQQSEASSTHPIRNWSIVILLTGIVILGVRGGLQLKPIRPNMAFVLSPNVLGNLVLNTPFTMIQTAQLPSVKHLNYYASEQECRKMMEVPYGHRGAYPTTKKLNVVIIILESFSSQYTSFGNTWKGYTPFLDSISAQGVFFSRHLANGRTSIEGLPAIIASIPSLMKDEPYITSRYQANKLIGLGTVLKKEGYHTSFFHGGKNGTMGFDMFAQNAGYTHYYGLNEYGMFSEDYDGNWGIFDHKYLQYYVKKLSSFPQPFASCVFTLSSHQPYTIPKEFEGKFTDGPVPVVKAVKYADFALKQFFQTASKQPWFENTLFVITADHTQEYIHTWSLFNDYHVPLLFYAPRYLKPQLVTNKITQHADIMPSVLDLLGVQSAQSLPFGHSVFDTTYTGRAVNYQYDADWFYLFHNDILTVLKENGEVDFIPNKEGIDVSQPIYNGLKMKYVQEAKAIQQFHNNGIVENSWYNK